MRCESHQTSVCPCSNMKCPNQLAIRHALVTGGHVHVTIFQILRHIHKHNKHAWTILIMDHEAFSPNTVRKKLMCLQEQVVRCLLACCVHHWLVVVEAACCHATWLESLHIVHTLHHSWCHHDDRIARHHTWYHPTVRHHSW